MRRGAVKRLVCDRSIGAAALANGCKSDYRAKPGNTTLRPPSRGAGRHATPSKEA